MLTPQPYDFFLFLAW